MPKSKQSKTKKVVKDNRSIISEPSAKRSKTKKRQNSMSSDEDEPMINEDALLREEMKDFLVDEVENEDEARSNDDDRSEGHNSEEGELSDEDFELLDENIGRHSGGRVQISDDEDEVEERNRIGNDLFDPDADRLSTVALSNAEFQSGSEQSDEFLEMLGSKNKNRHRMSFADQQCYEDARNVFGVSNPYEFDDEITDKEELNAKEILKVKAKRTSLWNLIEPSELERGFAHDNDKKIIFEDIPERFQTRKVPVTQADDKELDLEAAWIFEYAFRANTLSRQVGFGISKLPGSDSQSLNEREELAKNQVRTVIQFIRNDYLEVPFIASYRKEEIGSLEVSDLWKIYDYDEKWCQLDQDKNKMLGLLNRMKEYIVNNTGDQRLRPITEADFNEVAGARVTEEHSDVYAHFQLYYGSETKRLRQWELCNDKDHNAVRGPKFKPCSRNDRYLMCMDSGLSAMAELFGLTSKEFAENFTVSRKHEVRQDPREPVEAASEFVCSNFQTAEDVLTGAIYLLALQISREPPVRKKLREIFRNRLKISVYPTKRGIHEIDKGHPLFGKHYIKDKPAKDLCFEEFLLYSKAKQNSLIEIKLHPDAEHETDSGNTMFDSLVRERIFHRDQFYYVVEEWNKLRTEVVRVCINDILLPIFAKEAYQRLLEEARDCVLRNCCAKLRKKLSISAYKPSITFTREDELNDEGTRVMAITYSPDRKEASFALVVDEDGMVLDHIRLAHMHKFVFSKRGDEAKLKKEDIESIRNLVLRRQPHIIGIAGEDFQALQLLRDLKFMVKDMVGKAQLQKEIPVEVADNDAAKVYMNSRNSRLEFATYPPLLRQAVSLARYILDPLVEICRLCNSDEDIRYMNLDFLQSEIPNSKLVQALQIECINKVNEAGVDVNRCLEFPHMSSLFQFVCGMGPRKASHFLKLLQKNDNLLESRVRLVDVFEMGLKVFNNAAAFILIDTDQVSKRTDAYVEILDGSRVHPESYDWARKIASDALDIEGDDATEALEQIPKYPERLHALDLEFFAAELCSQGSSDKSVTLLKIRDELLNPFKDLRLEHKMPEGKELFEMLAKDDVYPEGKLVKGRIKNILYRKPEKEEVLIPLLNNQKDSWECAYCRTAGFTGTFDATEHKKKGKCPGIPVGVLVSLENGTVGCVTLKNISDTPNSFRNPSDVLAPNQIQMFRVIGFNADRVRYELSCRTSDLRKETPFNADPYFDEFRFKQDVE